MNHSNNVAVSATKNTASRPTLFWPSAAALLATVIFTSALFSQNAAARDLYKWTDEEGVLHYTDKRPTGVDAETINKKTRRYIPEEEPEDDEAAKKESTKQANAERCKTEKERLKVLSSSKSIRMKMDDGSTKVLSNEDIAQEIEFAKKAIQYFCE